MGCWPFYLIIWLSAKGPGSTLCTPFSVLSPLAVFPCGTPDAIHLSKSDFWNSYLRIHLIFSPPFENLQHRPAHCWMKQCLDPRSSIVIKAFGLCLAHELLASFTNLHHFCTFNLEIRHLSCSAPAQAQLTCKVQTVTLSSSLQGIPFISCEEYLSRLYVKFFNLNYLH